MNDSSHESTVWPTVPTERVTISLVLPAYNEAGSIGLAIQEAETALRSISDRFEIIVVDDGSSDGTVEVAEQQSRIHATVRVIRHDQNQGYGAALRTGFKAANYDIVAFTDADRQFDLNELERFTLLARDYDIVCGYRIDRQDPWIRCLYSKVYNVLVRMLLGTGVRDIDCAFKVFRKEALSNLAITTDGFLVNSELLTQANQQGCSIVEVGVTHRPRREGQSTVSVSHIPVVLVSLLRYWWNNVMFSGRDVPRPELPKTDRQWSSRWPTILLIAFAAIFFFANLNYPLIDRDETRYAEIPREMLASGNWILPQLNFKPYYDKPPLFYWLCAISYQMLGISEQSVRYVVASSGFSIVALTLWFGRRMLGQRASRLGAMAMLASTGFLFCGRFLIIDSVLSVLVALSLFAAYEAIRGKGLQWRWWLLSAIACGLGILAKGPVAAVLLGPPVFAYAFLTKGGSVLRIRHWLALGAIAACVALPWFVAVSMQDASFLYEFFYKHNLSRFAGAFHAKPFWFYIPIVFAGGHPWTFLAIPYAMFLLSRKRETRSMRPPAMGFLLLWSGWCLFFFSISKCKLPAYILPAAPAMALLVGHYLDHLLSDTRIESTRSLFRMARHYSPWMSAGTTCLVALALGVAAYFMNIVTLPALILTIVCWCLALLAAVVLSLRIQPNWRAGWVVSVCMAMALAGQVTQSWLPALGKSQTILTAGSSFTQWLRNNQTPIGTFGDDLSSIPFYVKRNDISNFEGKDLPRLVDFINRYPRTVLVVSTTDNLRLLGRALPPDIELRELGVRGRARILVTERRDATMHVATSEIPKYDPL